MSKLFYTLTVLIFFGTKETTAQNCWRNTSSFKGDTSILGLTKSEKKLYMDNIKRIKKYVEAYPVLSEFTFLILPDQNFLNSYEADRFEPDDMYVDSKGQICLQKSHLLTETDSDGYFSFNICLELFYASHKTFSYKHEFSSGQRLLLTIKENNPKDTVYNLDFLINYDGFSILARGFKFSNPFHSPYIYRGIERDAANYVASRVLKKANPTVNLAEHYISRLNLFELLENKNLITYNVVAEYGKYNDLAGLIHTITDDYQKFFDSYFIISMDKGGCFIVSYPYLIPDK